ncbi:hypothetical protein SAMN05661080_01033 [Modestobacter sp. DSM 44400]|uniref:hypothetical protein n=1 Tax=Modestobacter sp. DSM 44400 TaxID=1550230 RepID=UPI0008981913|nr:hypothetical protein [Modestobacter sp. DSM 44400]SDX74750.1 hypothetical protein SAMN05661080_01033 [Modestobacter sp. DSM 44400]
MATDPYRPPWFANRGVQLLAAGALIYNAVRLVLRLVDGEWGAAFLAFAWSVLFGYVAIESLRFRRQQDAAGEQADDAPAEPTD